MTKLSALARIAISSLALAAAGVTSANAQYYNAPPPQYRNNPEIDRYSGYAREGVGAAYGYAGRRACGSLCGRAARDFGRGVYDQSRDFSVRGGERLQEYGRSLRNRNCWGRSGTAGSTPQYCY